MSENQKDDISSLCEVRKELDKLHNQNDHLTEEVALLIQSDKSTLCNSPVESSSDYDDESLEDFANHADKSKCESEVSFSTENNDFVRFTIKNLKGGVIEKEVPKLSTRVKLVDTTESKNSQEKNQGSNKGAPITYNANIIAVGNEAAGATCVPLFLICYVVFLSVCLWFIFLIGFSL